MTSVETSGKTIEDALTKALAELGVSLQQVDYEVLEEPSKGLFGFIGTKPAKILVTVKEVKIDPVQTAEKFLTDIFSAMKLPVEIHTAATAEVTTFNMRGTDLGVLIGKHGQTLDALQYLTNLAANRDSDARVKIVLDVEDYRQRRAETLQRLAARLADQVKRRGEKVVLEPMSPLERKIIHMALQEDSRITTFSEGDEPYRKVVIALKR